MFCLVSAPVSFCTICFVDVRALFLFALQPLVFDREATTVAYGGLCIRDVTCWLLLVVGELCKVTPAGIGPVLPCLPARPADSSQPAGSGWRAPRDNPLDSSIAFPKLGKTLNCPKCELDRVSVVCSLPLARWGDAFVKEFPFILFLTPSEGTEGPVATE